MPRGTNFGGPTGNAKSAGLPVIAGLDEVLDEMGALLSVPGYNRVADAKLTIEQLYEALEAAIFGLEKNGYPESAALLRPALKKARGE